MDTQAKIITIVTSIIVVLVVGFAAYRINRQHNVTVDTNNQTASTQSSETAGSSLPFDVSINDQFTMPIATIETTKGTIKLELFKNDAPNTVANFITLAEKGFYDGVIFHRVIKDFMIQGGDPTGTGTGGPGYKFADELNPNTESAKRGYIRGTLAMANAGPNTNGSQFFIMHKDVPLPFSYTIFGRVISGIETVDAIAESATDAHDKPLEDIVIKHITISEGN